jgi:hypothetical protein
LTRRFYWEIRRKNLWERAELEVDPPFARPPQRAKTARRGSRSRSEGWGHPLFVGDQDSKDLVWATRQEETMDVLAAAMPPMMPTTQPVTPR